MKNEQKVTDIMRNRNPDITYYVKAINVNRLKTSEDEDNMIEDFLIHKDTEEDTIDKLLDNYLIIWIEMFKTINDKGEIIYKIDELKLMEIIYKLRFDKDLNTEEEKKSSFTNNVITKDPYIIEITKELMDFIQNDKKLQDILEKNEFNIIGLLENGEFVFKLIDKDMNVLTIINIPVNSNEITRYMRFSLFIEQIKSVIKHK